VKARIEVRLKPGILDPQGKAIAGALSGLGFRDLGEVRQGKLIEVELAGMSDPAGAAEAVDAMCRTLLANPVTEDYRIELIDT
jgi:phosphoribosylformylglycinamidine synthase